ncbi:MAG: flagellar assembly protein FliX [Alphaproteobacteria bacterium]|nr:flagellar assembly protein FliX [Alphaproteobacteria bacterium]
MKINQVGTSGTASARRSGKSDKGSGAAFVEHLQKFADEVEETPMADAPSTISSVDALLAMQTATDDESDGKEARRRAMARGEQILDGLEAVRQGLLAGSIPIDRLTALAQMVRSRREQGVDPRLAAILDEIELRAEIELAKLSRRPPP